MQGGAVSPIVTLEPRRRKFHKPITVNMPLPERSLRTIKTGLGDGSTSAGSSRKTSSESLNKLKGLFIAKHGLFFLAVLHKYIGPKSNLLRV